MSESWNCRDHDDTIKEHVKDRVKVTHAAIAAKHLAAVGTLTPQTPLSCTLWLVMTFHRANRKTREPHGPCFSTGKRGFINAVEC